MVSLVLVCSPAVVSNTTGLFQTPGACRLLRTDLVIFYEIYTELVKPSLSADSIMFFKMEKL